jgi:hypothetical protein
VNPSITSNPITAKTRSTHLVRIDDDGFSMPAFPFAPVPAGNFCNEVCSFIVDDDFFGASLWQFTAALYLRYIYVSIALLYNAQLDLRAGALGSNGKNGDGSD